MFPDISADSSHFFFSRGTCSDLLAETVNGSDFKLLIENRAVLYFETYMIPFFRFDALIMYLPLRAPIW